jgi:endonuclease/exonuclease/phosphatase family metal-dependent hydrolase
VQRSAYPSAYADDEPLARRLLAELGTGLLPAPTTGIDCAALPGGGGTVTFPLPDGSRYVDRRNFGATGASWGSTHTGTDLSVACGTEVYAATNGTVAIRTDQPWAGPGLVQVATAPGRLTTWYAHLERVDVAEGEYVTAGQVIGAVGEEGNATGCHLHFEVHPRGGSTYEDAVDPTGWLAQNVGTTLGLGARFTVASFNVLGNSHTAPGGKRSSMASGRVRIRWALDLLERADVEVAGLQELQRVQAERFRSLTGGRWELWHAPGDTDNAVAWRTDRWVPVERRLTPIPYFGGRIRQMPVIRLRHRATGAQIWVISVHNPADTRFSPHNAEHRRDAVTREVRLVRTLLAATNVPVILTGDLNERETAFCRLTANGALTAAPGGSHNGGRCQPPAFRGIDWVFGTRHLTWSGWTVNRSPAVRRTSDHPLVYATAAM